MDRVDLCPSLFDILTFVILAIFCGDFFDPIFLTLIRGYQRHPRLKKLVPKQVREKRDVSECSLSQGQRA